MIRNQLALIAGATLPRAPAAAAGLKIWGTLVDISISPSVIGIGIFLRPSRKIVEKLLAEQACISEPDSKDHGANHCQNYGRPAE